ncbi:MAG: hypothetical protein EBZ48_16260, partial [Proteobacteria bacterium]|nr:hypothetical protein [Pseudomonadota bacterium]
MPTPKNPFELLADLNSDSDVEASSAQAVAPAPSVQPVPAAPTAPPPTYQPTTPPFRPWPEGHVPPPSALPSPSPFKQRRKGRLVHHTSEDGWTSIRAVEGAPRTPAPREPEILYEMRAESPLLMD